MPTPHNNAPSGAFAKVVLMPGDPLRAKWIAETFLEKAELVNNVRGVNGYTGYTKNGKRISVMASGMGMASIGIYSYELFNLYDVDAIIRIGTSGSYVKEVKLGDIVLAQTSSTENNWSAQFGLNGGTLSACADFELLSAAAEEAKKKGIKIHAGNVLATDQFYNFDKEVWKRWAAVGVLAVEMEAYSLYINAALSRKKALCMLTISDSFVQVGELSPEQRQTGLTDMIEVAIAAAERFC
ncbi:MAG: purine-nucleoside phosphorylase [Bacilli bacterium]|nr:purine-nucleoside phosphorylase [Bacilli bacterium]